MSRQPVRNTCPDIDKALRILDNVFKTIKGRRSEDIDDMEDDILYDIESNLSDIPDYFESLRESNDKLRQWGSDEESEVDRLTDEISTMQDEIDKLQEQLDEINNQANEH